MARRPIRDNRGRIVGWSEEPEPTRRSQRRHDVASDADRGPKKRSSAFGRGGPLEPPGSRISRRAESDVRREREEVASRRVREGRVRPRPARRLMSLEEQVAREGGAEDLAI
jgi:hypothetical protein